MPDGVLCDMPSGGGYLADRLRDGLSYVGVDPSCDFVAFASEVAGWIVRAKLTDVPLEPQSIDYVVSLGGLHHEPALNTVFREMRRLIRPGGRLVIADVGASTSPARFLNGFVARTNPMGHDGHFIDDGTGPLLKDSGFEVTSDELVETPWVFSDVHQAGGFAAQLFGTTGASDADMAEALASEIGFSPDRGEVRLNWSLRRFICAVN